jgi:hypothetical protein
MKSIDNSIEQTDRQTERQPADTDLAATVSRVADARRVWCTSKPVNKSILYLYR